ncbi:MAG: S8 family serine peptidase [Candidatus Pacebacteria bacterium]|nr:S8 family serine peptidase [Candidatus Paceibacterota bacterium]
MLPTQVLAISLNDKFAEIDQRKAEKSLQIDQRMQEIFSTVGQKQREVQSRVQYKHDSIVVKYKNDTERFRTINIPAGTTVSDAIKKYRTFDNVEYVEPDYIAYADFVPNDPYYSIQWHMDNETNSGINAEQAWDITKGSNTVIVAVIDTGIAYENYYDRRKDTQYSQAPDLANTCFVAGYDFINRDRHPNDDHRHGTHVAGTVAQSTDNNMGAAGVAPDTCLMPVKALGADGSGSYTAIANAIYFAVDNGADIINMSLGGNSASSILEDAVAYAYNNEVTVIAAAGNNNSTAPHYPASYNEYVISVGATDFNKDRAYYSTYGSDVDVAAPGGDVTADENGDGHKDGVLQQTFSSYPTNFGYWLYQGTSMASPHVAGTAALLMANGNATNPDDIREALESTAQNINDPSLGAGLIDATAALGWLTGDNRLPIANAGEDQIVSDSDGNNLEIIILDGRGSTDLDGTIVSYEWKEGATTIANNPTTTQSVNVETTHIYTLTVTDNNGATSSDDVMVEVIPNQAPTAVAVVDPTDIFINTNVLFDANGSYDDGTIVSYVWDFGDETTREGITTTHTYTATGTYAMILTVTDDNGATSTDSVEIIVTEEPLEIFYDSFEISAVDEWNGLWTEDSQNDWERATQRATDGSYSAEIDGRAVDATLTSIDIDLQGHTEATITFDWLTEQSLDSGEYLAFDLSVDGGEWVEKGALGIWIKGITRENVIAEDLWHSEEFNVSGTSSIKLRFRGKMSNSREDANVDNVRVTVN